MATLTSEQIAQVAVNAGFNAGDTRNLIICVAIAKAESGGRTDAVNNNTNGTADRGVWQINDVHNAKLPGADRFDPNVNAQLMMMISSSGANWQPWSTYNNGAYNSHTSEVSNALMGKKFTPNTPVPLAGGTGSAEVQNVGLTSDVTSSIVTFFNNLTDEHFWVRIAKGFLGVFAITFGSVQLLMASGALGDAVSIASKVVPEAKVASVVGAVS